MNLNTLFTSNEYRHVNVLNEIAIQKQAFRVHHCERREASLRHCSGWGTEAFPLSSVICAAVV